MLPQLHQAIKEGNVEIVNEMIKQGALREINSKYEGILISSAAVRGHQDIISSLVEAGLEPERCREPKYHPLLLAAQYNHIKVIRLLCKMGVNVNFEREDGNSALQMAVLSGNLEIVKLLLRNNANPRRSSPSCSTPLFRAAALGYNDIVLQLLRYDVNKEYITKIYDKESGIVPGFTPLIAAAKNGHIDVCKSLIRAGARSNVYVPMNLNGNVTMVPAVHYIARNAKSFSECIGVRTLLFEGRIVHSARIRSKLLTLMESEMKDCSKGSENKEETSSSSVAGHDLTPPDPSSSSSSSSKLACASMTRVIPCLIREAFGCYDAQERVLPYLAVVFEKRYVPTAIILEIIGHEDAMLDRRRVWISHPDLTSKSKELLSLSSERNLTLAYNLVGRRILVRWAGGREYTGKIHEYLPDRMKHKVLYEDGDMREYDLRALFHNDYAGRFRLIPSEMFSPRVY